MRDIPVFCSEYGAASLILKKIPYTKEAYIYIRDTQTPNELLKECRDFCVAAGAETIYATGHEILASYPRYTTVLRMQCDRGSLPQTDAMLFPVQDGTWEQWRKVYNEKMLRVPTAAYLGYLEKDKVMGRAYFVHDKGTLLGIGMITEGNIDAIASVVKGAGMEVLLALSSLTGFDTITLLVADNNLPAVNLYRRAGFLTVSEQESWYKIF